MLDPQHIGLLDMDPNPGPQKYEDPKIVRSKFYLPNIHFYDRPECHYK